MHKYIFLEDQQTDPLLISYGQLGECQLIMQKDTKQLLVLKLAPNHEEYKRGILLLQKMRHPNIINLIQYFEHEKNLLIIFQFLTNGDLYTKIKCQQIDKRQIKNIFKNICRGIEYTHRNGVIHRNIKSESFILDQNMNPKIVDFCLAARLTTRKTFCGCSLYMAPQILRNQKYSQKVDIWALGIILYQMIHGDVPFVGETPQQILQQIQSSSIYSEIYHPKSPDHLVQRILKLEPSIRPSIPQILSHPYFRQYHQQQKKKVIKLNYFDTYQPNLIKSSHNCTKPDSPIFSFQKISHYFNNKLDALKSSNKIEKNNQYNFGVFDNVKSQTKK